MTRGKIVVVLNGKVMLISTEFNGDMYYEGHGEEVIEGLRKVNSVEEYEEFVKEFNRKNFEYEEDLIYKVEGDKFEDYLDMSVGYFDKWFSDYVYIKNLSDETIKFIDMEGLTCTLESGKIGVFNFGEIAEDIQENKLEVVIDDITSYIQSLVNNGNVDMCDMYNKCYGLDGVYTDCIYSKESLIDIMYEHAKNGDTFYAMARDIDDNSGCDFFLFDWSCWGQGCTPIETKEELAQVLLDGSL